MFVNVFGFDNYEIDIDGNVYRKKSTTHSIGYGKTKEYYRTLDRKKIQPFKNGSGYMQIILTKNKKRFNLYVHVLVWESFNNKKRPGGYEIDHLNFNKEDNNLSNLECVTKKINHNRMVEHYRKNKKIIKCYICGKEMSNVSKNKLCRKCFEKERRVVKNRPSKEELFELLKKNSFTYVGKLFNVSDNSIRKWCKAYDIPSKASYYKQYK